MSRTARFAAIPSRSAMLPRMASSRILRHGSWSRTLANGRWRQSNASSASLRVAAHMAPQSGWQLHSERPDGGDYLAAADRLDYAAVRLAVRLRPDRPAWLPLA